MIELLDIIKNFTSYLALKEGNKWMKIQEQLLELETRFHEIHDKPKIDRNKLGHIKRELRLLRKSIAFALGTKRA